MAKPNVLARHHAAHPPSAVKPNVAVNQKPNYAAMPNVNPSLPAPVALDALNSRLGKLDAEDDDNELDDDDSDEDDQDRTTVPIHN
jgi:hypothetical protein